MSADGMTNASNAVPKKILGTVGQTLLLAIDRTRSGRVPILSLVAHGQRHSKEPAWTSPAIVFSHDTMVGFRRMSIA